MWSWSRVVDLLEGRRAQQEEDFNRELRAHLDLEAEERQEACHSSEEARYAAQRAFGNTSVVREEVREMWGWTWVERLIQDSRIGLRQFRKSPGFTAVAILTLALGIGANTAIFALVHAVMTQSLPVANPGQLYSLGDTKLCCDTTDIEDLRDNFAMVLRGAMAPVLLGLAIGLPVVFLGGYLIASQLYGVRSHDPLIPGIAVGGVLAISAVLAAVIPAGRAASIDPMRALRTE